MNRKRLGLFLFFDRDGIVDDYVLFLLKELRSVLTELIVIVNGSVNEAGYQALDAVADSVVIRENEGFDAGAWREGILTIAGKDKIRTFDELILTNDSYFGPFIPFSTVFERMERQKVDFWGLSVHGEVEGARCPYGYRPRYLQTYFLVFRKNVLQGEAFFQYWQDQPRFTKFNELSEQFSAVLTQTFADAGYSWGVFSDTADLESPDRSKNFDQHSFALFELMATRDYPILKRRSFLIPRAQALRFNDGFDLQRAIDFIHEKYDYDPKLIFDHLLRKYNTADLKESLNLNFVLSGASVESGSTSVRGNRCAVFAHVYYTDLFLELAERLNRVPDWMDLIVTTDSEEKAQSFRPLIRETAVIRVTPGRGRELSSLLVGCADLLMQYEIICFIHDKKSSQKEFRSVGKAFYELIWDATLHSTGYIENVLSLFERYPRLGVLTPPPPFWGTYFWSSTDYWTICYDEVKKLAARLNLDAKIERDKRLFSLGSVFWARTAALKPLLTAGFTLDDFPPEPMANDGTFSHAIERVIPFVAASERYLSGWVMSDDYARTLISDLQVMFDETKTRLIEYDEVRTSTFADFLDSLRKIPTWLRAARKVKAGVRRMSPNWVVKIYRKVRENHE